MASNYLQAGNESPSFPVFTNRFGVSMLSAGRFIAFCCALPVCEMAVAAPLDAFLAADQHLAVREFRLEAGYDAVNKTLDVFKVRDNDPLYGGTSVGDYRGTHLRATYSPLERWSIEGGLWQRKISYRVDDENISSWQTAVQYRLFESGYTSSTSYALRLSAWGNRASSLNKSSPTTLLDRTLDTLSVSNPTDHQLDLNLLATWRLSDRTEASVFIGAGKSRVGVDSISGSYTAADGCRYNLAFLATTVVAKLASPCGGFIDATVTSAVSYDIQREASYNASYVQLGGMWQWHNLDWRLTGGYHFQKLSRDHVDDLVTGRGGTSYRNNHILIGEVARKIGKNSAVFVRGQLMSNQFVGEIPFAYNSLTASKFSSRYGLASFGVMLAY